MLQQEKRSKPSRELAKVQRELANANKKLASIKLRGKLRKQRQVRGKLAVVVQNLIGKAVKEVTGEEM